MKAKAGGKWSKMPNINVSGKVRRKPGIFTIIFLVVGILISGCSSGFVSQGKEDTPAKLPPVSSNGPTNGLVQSNEEGLVTIEVKWLGLNNGQLAFAVVMDTHSVDLDSYDLGKLAILRDDGGKEYRPTSWESAAGGHHRQGTLVFSPPDSLTQNNAEYFELIIPDIAKVEERVFRWELP